MSEPRDRAGEGDATGGSQPDRDEGQLGEPVTELALLREERAPDRLLPRVRASIERRSFAAQILNLGMPVFLKTALEYVSVVFFALESGRRAAEEAKEKEES